MTTERIRVGTRASALALAQSGLVAHSIAAASGMRVELVPITSEGDLSKESLSTLGGTGIFASALREALLADRCDILVHSLKDLPTAPYDGLVIGAIPLRADARDALCARDGFTLATLPIGARVGTGSPRRVAQLKARRPDLTVVDLRGNVDTRLGRVTPGDLDAVVLAVAGLDRLGRLEAVTEFLELDNWPTAPGQGALGVEVRAESLEQLADVLSAINHAPSQLAALAERAVLALLEAGCSAPIGATAIIDAGMLMATATVYRPDGTEQLTASHAVALEGGADRSDPSPREQVANLDVADELGVDVGNQLLHLGAAALVSPGSVL